MRSFLYLLSFLLWSSASVPASAQNTQDVVTLESAYKQCLIAGQDTSGCGRTYLRQMDSTLTVLYEKVRSQLDAQGKADLFSEQKSWLLKKADFYKKQDENFSFHLQDGSWKPNMIWLVYENKAEFLKKRALSLAKRLKD